MNEPNSWTVCDLLDANENQCEVVNPGLRHFGANKRFAGPVETIKVFEDNVLVKAALGGPGGGRVLVVDGGASLRFALLGDMLGDMAVRNQWSGVIINGCVRDSRALALLPVGIMALATMPRKSVKRGEGQRGEDVHFGGVTFRAGHWVYADDDGVIVAPTELSTSAGE